MNRWGSELVISKMVTNTMVSVHEPNMIPQIAKRLKHFVATFYQLFEGIG